MQEYPDEAVCMWSSLRMSPFFSRHPMCLRGCPPPTLVYCRNPAVVGRGWPWSLTASLPLCGLTEPTMDT